MAIERVGLRIDTEVKGADILIRPKVGAISVANFELRSYAIAEGERAADAAIPLIKQLIQVKVKEKQLRHHTAATR